MATTQMETTPTPAAEVAAPAVVVSEEILAKKAAHAAKQQAASALAAERKAAKKALHEQRQAEAQQKRAENLEAKLKRKAVNMARSEEQRENKRKKLAEKAVKRDERTLMHEEQRKAKAQLGATVTLDLDAVIAHVQAAAGADVKVSVKGLIPSLSLTFGTAEAATAFVQKNAEATVGVKLGSRPAKDFSRMVYFPKDPNLTRKASVDALTAGLGEQKFAFVESYGLHVAVQFNSEAEAEAACAAFKSNGLCIGGVEVGEAATLGQPPRSSRSRRNQNQKDHKPAATDAGDAGDAMADN